MKKLIITFIATSMLSLFTACDDDSSSSSNGSIISCDTKRSIKDEPISSHFCIEAVATTENRIEWEKECVSETETDDGFTYYEESKKGSGCSSGYVLKCEDNGASFYFYDNSFKNITCEQFYNDDYDL